MEVNKTVDGWFTRVEKYTSGKISNFVAFLFFMVAFGALVGIITVHYWPNQALVAVFLPALAGAVAYYNRTFALVLFVLLILFIFL